MIKLTRRMSLKLPENLARLLEERAEKERRSINQMILILLEKALEE
jgi:hypothetical protein